MDPRKLQMCMLFFQFLITYSHLTERWEIERLARRRERYLFISQLLNSGMVADWSRKRTYKKKRYWVKQRSVDWWERVVQYHFTDQDWLENFRMTSSTFKFICSRLRPYLKSHSNVVRKPMAVEKKVAIALYKLASCAEYRLVANQFGTNKCVVHKCVYDFCTALYSEFKTDYLSMPNEIEAREIADGFEAMCGIPNIIGAIDGTHIPVLPPKVGYRDFINRKGWPSYNMLAVVDHLYRFRFATCQHVGSAHDAAVLRDSSLYKNANTLLPKVTKSVEGTEIPCFLIGDPAYPLLPWLIKGYKGNLTVEEESFNVYLSNGRVVVENAFGRLKARFRCLLKRMDINYQFVPHVVVACLILHNIIESRKDSFRQSWMEAVQQAELEFPQPLLRAARDFDDFSGSTTRDILRNYMLGFPLRRSRLQ